MLRYKDVKVQRVGEKMCEAENDIMNDAEFIETYCAYPGCGQKIEEGQGIYIGKNRYCHLGCISKHIYEEMH